VNGGSTTLSSVPESRYVRDSAVNAGTSTIPFVPDQCMREQLAHQVYQRCVIFCSECGNSYHSVPDLCEILQYSECGNSYHIMCSRGVCDYEL
jgi:hypothetical protein